MINGARSSHGCRSTSTRHFYRVTSAQDENDWLSCFDSIFGSNLNCWKLVQSIEEEQPTRATFSFRDWSCRSAVCVCVFTLGPFSTGRQHFRSSTFLLLDKQQTHLAHPKELVREEWKGARQDGQWVRLVWRSLSSLFQRDFFTVVIIIIIITDVKSAAIAAGCLLATGSRVFGYRQVLRRKFSLYNTHTQDGQATLLIELTFRLCRHNKLAPFPVGRFFFHRLEFIKQNIRQNGNHASSGLVK